ncbi:MAG: toll/interleukin-1 receptor domain-containing protein [Verrucomicrobiota bacterium]|nr:toll/interleukin-1 receptor domain-containing protein [Verrucomicrobiota bacterium]
MSDIFISYAREDREKAQAIAAVFQEQGWSVWWDRSIPPGRTFDQVIEEARPKKAGRRPSYGNYNARPRARKFERVCRPRNPASG